MRVDLRDGGAIVSLVAEGREWLVQGPRRSAVTGASSYVAVPPNGWDEMFPTIDACVVDGWSVPDHGEAWRTAWSWTPDSMSFRCARGMTLTRSITSDARTTRLDYVVESGVDQPFLWAAHPLFVAEPGTRVALDRPHGEVLEVTSTGTRAVELRPELLTSDSLEGGAYRKLVWPSSVRVGAATVVHPDGTWLRMSWDLGAVPYLAVYLERSAFTRTDCIAIEPMTGWYDSLADALSRGLVSRAGPGRPARWHVEVRSGRVA